MNMPKPRVQGTQPGNSAMRLDISSSSTSTRKIASMAGQRGSRRERGAGSARVVEGWLIGWQDRRPAARTPPFSSLPTSLAAWGDLDQLDFRLIFRRYPPSRGGLGGGAFGPARGGR